MATSILRRTCKPLANRLARKPLAFPSEGFAVIPADERIEEETLPNYATSQYYPVAIGEIFRAPARPLPGRGQTGFRNYINGMAGAGSKRASACCS
ncbi:hypothetical protein E4U27_005425 [Claviceps purpurea]|nr:hypothetical protein E4U27_005425 [Claviceps purpurea]